MTDRAIELLYKLFTSSLDFLESRELSFLLQRGVPPPPRLLLLPLKKPDPTELSQRISFRVPVGLRVYQWPPPVAPGGRPLAQPVPRDFRNARFTGTSCLAYLRDAWMTRPGVLRMDHTNSAHTQQVVPLRGAYQSWFLTSFAGPPDLSSLPITFFCTATCYQHGEKHYHTVFCLPWYHTESAVRSLLQLGAEASMALAPVQTSVARCCQYIIRQADLATLSSSAGTAPSSIIHEAQQPQYEVLARVSPTGLPLYERQAPPYLWAASDTRPRSRLVRYLVPPPFLLPAVEVRYLRWGECLEEGDRVFGHTFTLSLPSYLLSPLTNNTQLQSYSNITYLGEPAVRLDRADPEQIRAMASREGIWHSLALLLVKEEPQSDQAEA